MHYGGHMREAFEQWVYDGLPDTARLEVDYAEVEWPATKFLGRFVHCSDIMPGSLCGDLGMEPGSTYARAAQELLRERTAQRR
jgi:hypothetical protein